MNKKQNEATSILAENKGKIAIGVAAVGAALLGWMSVGDLQMVYECVQAN